MSPLGKNFNRSCRIKSQVPNSNYTTQAEGGLPVKKVACKQAPNWGIGRRQKSSSERKGGEKEIEGACVHSFDAAAPPLVINL